MEQKILITVSLSILLLLGIIFFWWPQYQDFNNLRPQIKEKKIQLENKEQYFSDLKNLSLSLKKYGSELSKIDSGLPESPGIPDLLHFFGKVSSQNGLVLEKINLGKVSPLVKEDKSSSPPLADARVEEESKIQKISLGLSLSGSYPAFKNFLSTLEKSSRLIEVESISLSSPEKDEVFTFDLEIKAYSY